MSNRTHMKLSTRIPLALFDRLEDERHRLSREEGRRVSGRALVERAIERWLATVTTGEARP